MVSVRKGGPVGEPLLSSHWLTGRRCAECSVAEIQESSARLSVSQFGYLYRVLSGK